MAAEGAPRKRAPPPHRPLSPHAPGTSTAAYLTESPTATSVAKRPRLSSPQATPTGSALTAPSSIALVPAHLQTDRFARRPRRQSTLFFSSSSRPLPPPPSSSTPTSSSGIVAPTAAMSDDGDEPDATRRQRAREALVESPNGETLRRKGEAVSRAGER